MIRLKEGSTIPVYLQTSKINSYNKPLYPAFPVSVITAFSMFYKDLAEKRKVSFISIGLVNGVAWPEWVVKFVLDWMLECCSGGGIVKLVIGKEECGFFKLAQLLDLAVYMKMQFLERKIMDELKWLGKNQVRSENIFPIYDCYGPDDEPRKILVDSIARKLFKNDIKGKKALDEARNELSTLTDEFEEELKVKMAEVALEPPEEEKTGEEGAEAGGEGGGWNTETSTAINSPDGGGWEDAQAGGGGDATWADDTGKAAMGGGEWAAEMNAENEKPQASGW